MIEPWLPTHPKTLIIPQDMSKKHQAEKARIRAMREDEPGRRQAEI